MNESSGIWNKPVSAERLNESAPRTLHENLGIRVTEVGDDYVEATMPVDDRTVQPYRLLHGGASVALAESLGSIASVLCLADPETQMPVGVEINANHLRPVPEGGEVTGRVSALHLGRRTQVWHIEIRNAEKKLVCVSRLTIAIVERTS